MTIGLLAATAAYPLRESWFSRILERTKRLIKSTFTAMNLTEGKKGLKQSNYSLVFAGEDWAAC